MPRDDTTVILPSRNTAGNVPAGFGLSPIPAQAGIGLKPQHFGDILETLPPIDWFEIHPENYLMDGGPMLHYLTRIREHYLLSFHSVGMSLGSVDGIDETHILKLKKLAQRFQPALISDHLSWTRWQSTSLNDLLPMPYTQEALAIMVDNVDRVQNLLQQPIAVENPSSYFDLRHADMDEADFLVTLAQRSGATILLDINNVYVSACNHGWCAQDYLDRIPADLVSEIHLAGHKVEQVRGGELRIDDHGSQVCEAVWTLFASTLQKTGAKPTLIEWDTDVPAFSLLQEEAGRADTILKTVRQPLIAGVQINQAPGVGARHICG